MPRATAIRCHWPPDSSRPEVLEDRRGVRPPGGDVHGGEREAVHHDPAGGRLVHAGEQLDQGAFAGAVLPDQRDRRARLEVQVDPVEHRRGGAGVDEPHALQGDPPPEPVGHRKVALRGLLGRPHVGGRVVLQPQDPASGPRGGQHLRQPGGGRDDHCLGPQDDRRREDDLAQRGLAAGRPDGDHHEPGQEARREEQPAGGLPEAAHHGGPAHPLPDPCGGRPVPVVQLVHGTVDPQLARRRLGRGEVEQLRGVPGRRPAPRRRAPAVESRLCSPKNAATTQMGSTASGG
jgi:hypothetical protein